MGLKPLFAPLPRLKRTWLTLAHGRLGFYRRIPTGKSAVSSEQPLQLTFTETEKTFDPKAVYGDAPNPTQL